MWTDICSFKLQIVSRSVKNVLTMTDTILPGTNIIVDDETSIYNGYIGFVQRISEDKAGVFIDSHPWEKLITMPISKIKKI